MEKERVVGVEKGEPRLLRELLSLAAPTVAQMASYTVMQFVDTWMLARQGPLQAAAGANSGIMSYSALSLGIGVLWVINTLASQAFGRKEEERCGIFMWQGIWFAIAYAILLLPTLSLARPMFLAFGHPADLAGWEAVYFRISVGGAGLKLVATALGQFLLATDRPRAVLVASLCGVCVDAISAWVLIFGKMGIPALGVAGSAWATNIGVACEMGVLIGVVAKPSIWRRFGLGEWKVRFSEMGTLLRIGVPSGVQSVADMLAWSLFCNWVIGAVGAAAMSANAFMLRYMVVSFMPAIGISVAVTALVGRWIGRGNTEMARRTAHLGYAVMASWQGACGVVFLLGRHVLLRPFTDDPALLEVGGVYMIYGAIYQLFDALFINYNGALRGAGDTLVPALITAVFNWSINVGGGYWVARHVPQLGPAGPWLVATVYGAIVGAVMWGRFVQGKWVGIRVEAAQRVPVMGEPYP